MKYYVDVMWIFKTLFWFFLYLFQPNQSQGKIYREMRNHVIFRIQKILYLKILSNFSRTATITIWTWLRQKKQAQGFLAVTLVTDIQPLVWSCVYKYLKNIIRSNGDVGQSIGVVPGIYEKFDAPLYQFCPLLTFMI